MSRAFEVIDHQDTRMGLLTLRRRLHPSLGRDVYEVLLGDEHLMSNVFTAAERELARLALAAHGGSSIDVVVGGLGLGYTAGAALDDPRVRRCVVVDALGPVIGWHEAGLLPESPQLASDDRCELVHGDFFALLGSGGFGTAIDGQVDVVLLDIDHTPRHVLDAGHRRFYTEAGLAEFAEVLRPDGVFALWADTGPDDAFVASCRSVFSTCEAHVVPFANPLTGGEASNVVYVARR